MLHIIIHHTHFEPTKASDKVNAMSKHINSQDHFKNISERKFKGPTQTMQNDKVEISKAYLACELNK